MRLLRCIASAQVPTMIRRSLRRPSDPSGTTVPANRAPRKPADLLPFLPSKLPRFKPGDRPLPASAASARSGKCIIPP